MLQRIYGTAFATKEALEKRLFALEEAKRRDHRKLGRELELFSIEEEVGPGFVIWHPKGALLRTILEDFERKRASAARLPHRHGPPDPRKELWEKSGHYDNYRENMYFTEVEGQSYGIKPMNCLAHMLIYKSKMRSYRDLPLRYFELGTVHRHEKSGRAARAYPRARLHPGRRAHPVHPRAAQDEITGIIKFVRDVMGLFGFDYEVELSTRPEKSIGDDRDLGTGHRRAASGARPPTASRTKPVRARALFTARRSTSSSRTRLTGSGSVLQSKPILPCRSGLILTYIGRRWRTTTARHAPPGHPRLHRAVHRGADRALRRGVSHLVGSRFRSSCSPSPTRHARLRPDGGGDVARSRISASSWTAATRSWATRSARRGFSTSPTCWSSGTRRSSPGR